MDDIKLSPSGAFGWMRCPARPRVEAGYPRTSSAAADEGTAAHDFVHTCMRTGFELSDFLGETWDTTGYKLAITQEVVNFLQPGVDRFEELCNDGSGNKPDIEAKIPIDPWIPGKNGVIDRGYAGRDVIIIDDLKYGRGKPETPEQNYQLTLYGLAYWHHVARHKTSATNFKFIIDQPRNSAGGGEWDVTLAELLALGDKLKEGAERTKDPNAPRIASVEGCSFCSGKPDCPEYAKFNLAIVSQSFDDLDNGIALDKPPHLVTPVAMTPARLRYVWEHRAVFSKWLKEVEGQCAAYVNSKHPEIRMKFIAGKPGDREWSDLERVAPLVEFVLGDEAYTKKLLSVAQVEKKLDRRTWAKMQEVPEGTPKLISRADGKPTLALLEDDRPAIDTAAMIADMFDVVED